LPDFLEASLLELLEDVLLEVSWLYPTKITKIRWIMTSRDKSRLQAAEIRFLR
jgi:hypothetical protein